VLKFFLVKKKLRFKPIEGQKEIEINSSSFFFFF
jgi:hypothetical protein